MGSFFGQFERLRGGHSYTLTWFSLKTSLLAKLRRLTRRPTDGRRIARLAASHYMKGMRVLISKTRGKEALLTPMWRRFWGVMAALNTTKRGRNLGQTMIFVTLNKFITTPKQFTALISGLKKCRTLQSYSAQRTRYVLALGISRCTLGYKRDETTADWKRS